MNDNIKLIIPNDNSIEVSSQLHGKQFLAISINPVTQDYEAHYHNLSRMEVVMMCEWLKLNQFINKVENLL